MKMLPPTYLAAVVLSFASHVIIEPLIADAVDVPPAVLDLPAPSTETFEILGFERRHFTIQRAHGKVLIDGVAVPSDVVERGTKEVRLIEHFDGLNFDSSTDFRNLAKKLRGIQTYTYDVVFFRDANHREQTIPLVLLPNDQRRDAEDEWRQWLASERNAAEQSRAAQRKAELEERKFSVLEEAIKKQSTTPSELALSEPAVSVDNQFLDRWRVYVAPANQALHRFTNSIQASSFQVAGIQLGTREVLYQPASSTSIDVVATNSLLASQSVLASYPNAQIVGIQKLYDRSY